MKKAKIIETKEERLEIGEKKEIIKVDNNDLLISKSIFGAYYIYFKLSKKYLQPDGSFDKECYWLTEKEMTKALGNLVEKVNKYRESKSK